MNTQLKIHNLETVLKELKRAKNKWFNIGLKLELEAGDLDTIQESNRTNDTAYEEMIKKALTTKYITWEKIVEALRSEIVQLIVLADEIENKYSAKGRKRERADSDDQPESVKTQKVSDHTDYVEPATSKSKVKTDVPDTEGPLSEVRYPMSNRRALIINIVDVATKESRTGSRKDAADLKAILEELDYEVVTKENLKSSEIIPAIKDYANEDRNCDSFICCILTHGNKGVIVGTDRENVRIEQISEALSEDKIKHLRGKPKMFFFQACQGTNAKVSLDSSSTSAPEDKSAMIDMAVLKLPPDSDFFYGFASSYGTPAMRIGSGSLYIQELCKVFRRQYTQDDLLSMVTRVHDGVAKQEFDIGSDKQEKLYQQQPQLVSTLRKIVRF